MPYAERKRLESFNKLKEIEIMSDYLLKRNDTDSMPQIKDIVVWRDICEPNMFTSADVERVRKEHNEKL